MKLLFISILTFPIYYFSQSYSYLNSVPINAQVVNTNTAIQLNWENDTNASQYTLNRRDYGSSSWGGVISTQGAGQNTYIDNTVIAGQKYEYRIIRNSTNTAFGYICAGIETDIDFNPGILIMLVDDYFLPVLQQEIEQMKDDIEADGWFVHIIQVSRNDSPILIKAQILNEYNTNPNLIKGLVLLGHVPVPYSGDLNPDGHPDHLGAWPADVYYADMDGVWTDITVNNNAATDPRNQNIPNDGKFDQSVLPSNVEMEVSRIDFYNLPVFSSSEEQLMLAYLNKLHEFKFKNYTPGNIAIVEDNFIGMTEGFAGGAYTSFAPIVGTSNVLDSDYATELIGQTALWSCGVGPGWYTDASGIVSSSDFASNSFNSTFTMLFGSYFGDWDSQNNLLRSALGSGKILCSSWSGRPFIYYHPMGIGERIGKCIKMNQNNMSGYFSSTLGMFQKWVHISQIGDVTLRAHYLELPLNLVSIVEPNGSTLLNWNAPLNIVDGFHVYRRPIALESWSKLTTSPITTLSYNDTTIMNGGQYEYMVRSAEIMVSGSGSYWNQSLGIKTSIQSSADLIHEKNESFKFGPNPFFDILYIESNISEPLRISNIQGFQMFSSMCEKGKFSIETSVWPKGIYIIQKGQEVKIMVKI